MWDSVLSDDCQGERHGNCPCDHGHKDPPSRVRQPTPVWWAGLRSAALLFAVFGGAPKRRPRGIHRCNKAVTPSRQSFDKSRVARGIAERFPESCNGGVQTVLKVDEGTFRPQPM
jgi:hypothetical protein